MAPATAPAVGLGIGLEDDPEGRKITGVAPGGTAAALDIQLGDVLLQVGGRPGAGPQIVSEYVQSLKAGEAVRNLEALPNTTIHYYEVAGTNLAEINSSISARAPRDRVSGAVSTSSADWKIGLTAEQKAVASKCVIMSVQTRFSASVVLPRLVNNETVTGDLRKVWGQYVANLKANRANELWFIYNRLSDITQAITGRRCEDASRLASAAVENLKKQQVEFAHRNRKAPPTLKVPVKDPHEQWN